MKQNTENQTEGTKAVHKKITPFIPAIIGAILLATAITITIFGAWNSAALVLSYIFASAAIFMLFTAMAGTVIVLFNKNKAPSFLLATVISWIAAVCLFLMALLLKWGAAV